MDDHIVDTSAGRGRVDIRTGVGRQRRWSDEAKGRVVAESYAPGTVVSDTTLVCVAQGGANGPSGSAGGGGADVRPGVRFR